MDAAGQLKKSSFMIWAMAKESSNMRLRASWPQVELRLQGVWRTCHGILY